MKLPGIGDAYAQRIIAGRRVCPPLKLTDLSLCRDQTTALRTCSTRMFQLTRGC
jgi:hypothetical protein